MAGFDFRPSDSDVRHQLTGFANYQLPSPFSKGVGNKLFRNWELDSIFNARSARPLKFVTMFPTSFGVGYVLEDVSQRGFPLYQVDMALRRRFNFTDAVGLQIQADAFNIFNHPNFGTINTNLASTTFGQATNMLGTQLSGLTSLFQMGGPRSFQFALMLRF
jgi:hypothetical protein